MPEWEAFYFRKFFKNGYLVCISKTVRISAFCWNNFVTYIGHYIGTLYITYIGHYISALFNLSFVFIHGHGG